MPHTIFTIWPTASQERISDFLLLRVGRYPGFCTICGKVTVFLVPERNFRETTSCSRCNTKNRLRQIAHVLLDKAIPGKGTLKSLPQISADTRIWLAETTGGLHGALACHLGSNLVCSEFISEDIRSGTVVDGVLHVDMRATHFEDNSFDYILSSDVLEHIPDYLQSLKECHRVLRVGGCYIFTVPFYEHRFTIERRSFINEANEVVHLRKPWYHLDPLRKEGILCYNVFAPELLCELERVGFEAELLKLHSSFHGILGSNGFVIVARKAATPSHTVDFIFPE